MDINILKEKKDKAISSYINYFNRIFNLIEKNKKTINTYEKEINEYNDRIIKYRNQIIIKDNEIKKINQKIDSLEIKLGSLKKTWKKGNSDIVNIDKVIGKK